MGAVASAVIAAGALVVATFAFLWGARSRDWVADQQ
jgi:hypothetical protein